MAADPPIMQEWGMLDPRHGFHDGMPRLQDLVRPERAWAVPGDGYADAIVAIANRVIGRRCLFIEPTEHDIGYPVRVHYAADIGPPRAIGELRWFIVHDTEGYFAGDEQVLTSAIPPVESCPCPD